MDHYYNHYYHCVDLINRLGQSRTLLNYLEQSDHPRPQIILDHLGPYVSILNHQGKQKGPSQANLDHPNSQYWFGSFSNIQKYSPSPLSFNIPLFKVVDKDQRIQSLYLCELPPKLVQYLRKSNHRVKRYSNFTWI